MGLGVRWTPESFVKEAVLVGRPPLFNFSGFAKRRSLSVRVRGKCVTVDVIYNGCSKLGWWDISSDRKAMMIVHWRKTCQAVCFGWFGTTIPLLWKKLPTATTSQQDLKCNSKQSNDALQYITRSWGDEELDKRLWDRTMLEVERDLLLGPLPWDNLKKKLYSLGGFPWSNLGGYIL